MRQLCYGRRVARFLALVVACVACTVALAAHAAEPSKRDANAIFAEAEAAERAMRFDEADRLYRELLRDAPSSPRAPRARARAEDLEAHAEAGYAPLARLESVRRDARLAADPDALAALERDAASFPPGRVRAEARMLVAAGFVRLGAPSRALAPLSSVVADANADPLLRRLALGQLVEVKKGLGDVAGAVRDVDAFPDLVPEVRARVHREARRVWIRRGALGLVALMLALGAWSASKVVRASGLARGVRALVRPTPLVYAAWIALVGAALARGYDATDPRPFLLLGAGVACLDLAARAHALAVARALAVPIPTAARVALSVAAVAAVAFLALDHGDRTYLDGFGL